MRKQLNEQLARIKTMMGINEIEKVDLTNYYDDKPLITDIERVYKKNGKYPHHYVYDDYKFVIVSMTINAFMFDEGSTTKGTVFEVKVVAKFTTISHRMIELVSIQSEIPLNEHHKSFFQRIFMPFTDNDTLIKNLMKSSGHEFSDEEYRRLLNYLNRVIDGDEIEKDIPTKEVEPQETPKNYRKDIWTSTSTWDVK